MCSHACPTNNRVSPCAVAFTGCCFLPHSLWAFKFVSSILFLLLSLFLRPALALPPHRSLFLIVFTLLVFSVFSPFRSMHLTRDPALMHLIRDKAHSGGLLSAHLSFLSLKPLFCEPVTYSLGGWGVEATPNHFVLMMFYGRLVASYLEIWYLETHPEYETLERGDRCLPKT